MLNQDKMLEFVDRLGLSVWIAAPILFAVWAGGLWGLKILIYRRLHALSTRTASNLDDIVLYALSRPLAFLIVGSGLLVVGRLLPFSPGVDRGFLIGFRLMVVLAGASFTDRLLRRLIDEYAATQPILQSSRSLARGLARGIVFGLALFAVLDNLGISITPFLASLGVGSLAVALALKDTLANLFAGVQLVADRTIEVGQSVRLDSGEEGVVSKIGWRTTHIRTLSDVTVIVPNSRLTESRITNYDRPTSALSVSVELGVHYSSDLEKVERVALGVAREVQRSVPGAVPDHEPGFAFRNFGDSAIGITVVLRALDFAAQAKLRHQFVKRLHARFRAEGIVIPYPIRTLEVGDEVRESSGWGAGKVGGPRMARLDRQEKDLADSLDRDEWRSVPGQTREKKRYQRIAAATLRKDRLHKYAAGRLLERRIAGR